MTPRPLAALLAAAALAAGCTDEGTTMPAPPEPGRPYLDNGTCFVRDRAGRPVRIAPEKCRGLEQAN
ncbi:hypothetical protein H0I76_16555 [Limibaculum sp. M0105]|uniref:Lipoprotein n=1 Tax=Thermohalobaculum xanthum TaxID=2753746 RepID=A0A8J7SG49_9RHOB|nr:hypothetical protein [Thermohalobaculum xanthum]MBK0400813.1 hypothetical protein [Thermohalobaculum xanthum]